MRQSLNHHIGMKCTVVRRAANLVRPKKGIH